jgi:hypothetical protein
MNQYEVVIRTQRSYVFIVNADTPEAAQDVAEGRYEEGDTGDLFNESIDWIEVEKP